MFLVGNDFQWRGTIVAPNAEVVVGQSGINFYGAIYAKSIVIQRRIRSSSTLQTAPSTPIPATMKPISKNAWTR